MPNIGSCTCFQSRGLLDSGSSTSSPSDWLSLSDSHSLHNTSKLQASLACLVALLCNPLLPLQFLLCCRLLTNSKFQPLLYLASLATYHTQPVHFNAKLNHLNNLHLADPSFGQHSKVDILLSVDIYANVLLHGRRSGPPGTLETKFGWVLVGNTKDAPPIGQPSPLTMLQHSLVINITVGLHLIFM